MAKVQISITMPLQLFLKLDHYCEKNKIPRSHVIQQAVREFFEKREKK